MIKILPPEKCKILALRILKGGDFNGIRSSKVNYLWQNNGRNIEAVVEVVVENGEKIIVSVDSQTMSVREVSLDGKLITNQFNLSDVGSFADLDLVDVLDFNEAKEKIEKFARGVEFDDEPIAKISLEAEPVFQWTAVVERNTDSNSYLNMSLTPQGRILYLKEEDHR